LANNGQIHKLYCLFVLQGGCEACAAGVETYKIVTPTHYYVFDVGDSDKKYQIVTPDSSVALTLDMLFDYTAFLTVV
jgi:hypothetical protein